MVFDSNDHKTSLEQRTEKGIWQQLYQFPLIETAASVSEKEFLIRLSESNIIKEPLEKLLLFNAEDIIHKLSHQQLHIKFWILKTETVAKNAVKWSNITTYPVPAVIERFIKNFYN